MPYQTLSLKSLVSVEYVQGQVFQKLSAIAFTQVPED